MVATVSGWVTPTCRDHKDGSSIGAAPINGLLGRQVWHSSSALSQPEMVELSLSTGALRLNPAFSLWLMGYPDGWESCGVRATQSCRKSRRRS
jgi:hypothetical protein